MVPGSIDVTPVSAGVVTSFGVIQRRLSVAFLCWRSLILLE
jgi:hypothetical protein